MFRQLARWNHARLGGANPADNALPILAFHPEQLQRYLEERWSARPSPADRPALSVPPALLPTSGMADLLSDVADDIYEIGRGGVLVPWEHLIYAYMTEQTRIVEIFRRVAAEALHGEHLGALSPASQQWLRNAETLLFSDLPPGHVARVTSTLRPDPGAVRRNAYWRMFGLDLQHQAGDGSPYPYLKARASNTEFIRVLEDFLREVWRAIENASNTSGANPTDDSSIAHLARSLQEMLAARRQNGTLAREEFAAVAALDFLHLTILYDSPIVVDLAVDATSPDERLRKCGERVGIPAHPKSDAYLELADNMSLLLTRIEAGLHSTETTVMTLYTPGTIRAEMTQIITQWSAVTGRDMKAGKVTVSDRQPRPPRPVAPVPVPAAAPAPAATSNGSRAPSPVG